MLVKELAKTFGRFGIRVNALVPGAIAAGGSSPIPRSQDNIPLGRLARPPTLRRWRWRCCRTGYRLCHRRRDRDRRRPVADELVQPPELGICNL